MVKGIRMEERQESRQPFAEVEPWHEPINPAELLTEINNTIRRFIVCQPETAHAATLWIAMTWFMDVIQIAPLAVITAPEKRCGKSQLLFLLGRMVSRPLPASNITPAALFRSIDAWQPTLLIDEADAFMRENEELRGLLNCGHTRDSAYTIRVVGEDHTPKPFFVWGAKALAGIGHLAETLMDRAIILELRRKLGDEKVERLRHSGAAIFNTLSSKLARFSQDYAEKVKQSQPALPNSLNDRAQDNWEPLISIAEIAGGDWPRLATVAALKLSGETTRSQSISVELLADIQEIFEMKNIDRISSAELITALCFDEEKPWATYNRGFPIKPRQVASRLKEFGIMSNTIRLGYTTAKGYMKIDFSDVFGRYLVNTSAASVTTSQASVHQGLSVTDTLPVTDQNVTGNSKVTWEPSVLAGCYGVTDKMRETA
jgi:putative DNA primase/helicase